MDVYLSGVVVSISGSQQVSGVTFTVSPEDQDLSLVTHCPLSS